MGDGTNPFRKTEFYSDWSGYSQPQSDPNYRPESYSNPEHIKFVPYDNYTHTHSNPHFHNSQSNSHYPNSGTFSQTNSQGYSQSSNGYNQGSNAYGQSSNGYGQGSQYVPNSHNYSKPSTHYVSSHCIPSHTVTSNNISSNSIQSHGVSSSNNSVQLNNMKNVQYGQVGHVVGSVDGVSLPYQGQVLDGTNSFNRQNSEPIPVQYQDNVRYSFPKGNSGSTVAPGNSGSTVAPGNSVNGPYYQRNIPGYKNEPDVYYPNYMYYNGQMASRPSTDSRELNRDLTRDLSRDLSRDLPRELTRELNRDIPRDLPRDIPRDLTRPEIPRDLPRSELYFSRNYENLANKNFFNASLSFKEAATAMLSMDAKKSHSRQRTPSRGRPTARGLGKLQKPENTQTTSRPEQSISRAEQSGPRDPNSYQRFPNTKPIYHQNYNNTDPYTLYKDTNRVGDVNRDTNRVGDVTRGDVTGRSDPRVDPSRLADPRIVPMNRTDITRGDVPVVGRGDVPVVGREVPGVVREVPGVVRVDKDPVYNYYMINSKINSPEYAKYRNRGLQQLSQYNLMSQYSQQHGIGNYMSNLNNFNHIPNVHNVHNPHTVNLHGVNHHGVPGVNHPGVHGINHGVPGVNHGVSNFTGVRGFKKVPVSGQRFVPVPKSVPVRTEKHHVIEEIQADNDHMNNLKTNAISSASSIMESFQHSLSNKRKRVKNCLVEDCRNVIGEQPKIDVQYSSVEVDGRRKYLLSEILSSLLPYHTFYHEQLDPPRSTKFDYSEIRNQIQQVQTLLDNINNNEHIFNQSV
eukprot:XP_765848.1 hypothetical protein [Theileria parva strain Muguga]